MCLSLLLKQRRVVFPKNSVWVSSSILNFLSVTQWFKNDVEIFSFFNLQFSKCDSVFFYPSANLCRHIIF